MKVSKYIEAFRALSYSELFSSECLDALKNIQQSEYGKFDASQAIYEINLSKPDLTADASFRVHDDFPKVHWLEFDFENYSSGEKLQPCIYLEDDVLEAHEVLSKVFGHKKWEKFRKPVDDLKILLKDKKMIISHLGDMGCRGGKFSETIRIVLQMIKYQKTVELLKLLNYNCDVASFEKKVSEFAPYAFKNIFLFDFDIFPDGSISDRIGITFFAKTSLNDAENLMKFLVKKNFCSPERAEAIIKWRSGELPENIDVQEICHMKFQFEKDEIVAVKIYLRHRDFFLTL